MHGYTRNVITPDSGIVFRPQNSAVSAIEQDGLGKENGNRGDSDCGADDAMPEIEVIDLA